MPKEARGSRNKNKYVISGRYNIISLSGVALDIVIIDDIQVIFDKVRQNIYNRPRFLFTSLHQVEYGQKLIKIGIFKRNNIKYLYIAL